MIDSLTSKLLCAHQQQEPNKHTEIMEPSKTRRQNLEAWEGVDPDIDETPRQKKPRFPKGKKQKTGNEIDDAENGSAEGPLKATDPRLAATRRAARRRDRAEELLNARDTSVLDDIGEAEEEYEEDEENLEDDGIKIEPFNLKQEREEGYFDSEGNYVEYGNGNDIKDAWLDSVEVDSRFAEEHLKQSIQESEDDDDLSPEEISKIKRRIANALQPGETVLQALRRMKGASSGKNKREKMPAETKAIFDQLTDDAMKLMDGGDFNVYQEQKATFEREAEGYEAVARAKGGTLVGNRDLETENRNSSAGEAEDIFADDETEARVNDPLASTAPFVSVDMNLQSSHASSSGALSGTEDIFAENDEAVGQDTNSHHLISQGEAPQSTNSSGSDTFGGGATDSDYVYDESSGYYYSSKLGYYYDTATGLFCNAVSGRWYRFNEQSNTYEEMQDGSSELTYPSDQ